MKRIVWIVGAVALSASTLAGCTPESSPAPREGGASAASSPLIKHIPADTPYLVANLEPTPQAVRDKLWSAIQPALDTVQEQLAATRRALEGKAERTARDQLNLAILSELDGRLDREGLAALGIGGNYFALYADGVLPVLRIDLEDRAALLAAIDRIQEAAGFGFPRFQQGEGEYYAIRDPETPEGPTAYIALLPEQIAFGFAVRPEESARGAVRDALLGVSLPTEDASARIRQTNAAYGLLPYGTGVLEPTRLFDGILALATELAPDEVAAFTPACRADWRRLIAAVPEIASGYTRLDVTRIDQNTVVRLTDDLVPGVRSLATGMRGLDPVDEGMMYFAYGLDLNSLKSFAGQRIAALKADPLTCEQFSELMGGLTQAEAQLARPLPPFVGNIQGLRLLVEDVTVDDAGKPIGGKALAALMVANPQMLLGLAQSFVPQLAQLQLAPGGEPQRLPADLLPPTVGDVFLAMSQGGFAASVGPAMEARLKGFLDAPEPRGGRGPLVVLSYDMAKLSRVQQGFIEQAEKLAAASDDGAGEEAAEELAAAKARLESAMARYYEVFGRITLQAVASDKGIELPTSTTLN